MRLRVAMIAAMSMALLLIFSVSSTSAQTWTEQMTAAGGAAGFGAAEGSPVTVAVRIINIAFSLVGIIFLGLAVYAGFLWMTSAGGDDIDKAKKILRHAVIGLAVLLAAYSITAFILPALLRATS